MNIILIPTYAGEIWRQFDVAGMIRFSQKSNQGGLFLFRSK